MLYHLDDPTYHLDERYQFHDIVHLVICNIYNAQLISIVSVRLFFQFQVCGCLKMKGMEGPSLVNSDDIVTFTCRYDLGKDAIYSIKWYKEDDELYRYIPTDFPESRIFQGTPGVIVMVICN